jgi:pilus assembly protein CpaB
MQPRTWLAILALLGCAFAPIGLALMTLEREEGSSTSQLVAKPTGDAKSANEFVTVLVARRSVPQGTHLKQPGDWFQSRKLPRAEVPAYAVRSFDQLEGHVVAKSVDTGGTLDAGDLLRVEDAFIFIGMPKGKRALTIKVSHSDSLAYQPGSRVSVEHTVKSEPPGEEYKQIILENMLILATDPVNDSKPKEGSGPRADTVTLAVTPEEAQVLSLAQQIGTLRLLPASAK